MTNDMPPPPLPTAAIAAAAATATATETETATATEMAPVFKKRGAKATANIRKRDAATPASDNNDGGGSSESDSSGDEAGGGGGGGQKQQIKRRKPNKGVATTTATAGGGGGGGGNENDLSATVFTADRSNPLTNANDATKQTNWFDDELDVDIYSSGEGNVLPGKTRAQSLQLQEAKSAAPDGTYKGLANQSNFIQKNPDRPSRAAAVGPVRAATNVRTVTTMDYAPDVCKDYKQTGFCGFGDNCKYLHSREAYAAGWELDRDWEKVTKGKKNLGGTVVASADDRDKNKGKGKDAAAVNTTFAATTFAATTAAKAAAAANDDDDDDEDLLRGIPFACVICGKPYTSPVETLCGHYFCEKCALHRYRKKSLACAACGLSTNGVFNTARKLQKLLDRKRQRIENWRQTASEIGEDIKPQEEDEGYE